VANTPWPSDGGPTAGGGWRAATASLRYPQFRWVYASNVTFFFAMNGQFIVRSILAYRLTDNAFSLGLVNLAVALPMLVFSPFGGVVADRVERRRLILAAQSALLATEFVIFALILTDRIEFWHLVAVVFLMGVIFPFNFPARQAIVANIVGREGLANATALNMGGMNAARVAAPVLAGFLVTLISVKGAYAVSMALYVLALLAMTRVDRSPPDPNVQRKSVMGDLWDGVRYVRDDHPVRALMALSLIPILLAMPFQTLLVVFTTDVWEVGDAGLGALQAVAGFGGILGSVYVAWRGETRRKLRMMMSTLLAFAGTLFLFALSPWFALALPLVLISDVFASIFNTVNSTTINLIIPDAVRGRVMSLMMMTFGLTPLGTVPVSAAAEAWGAPAAVAGASALTAVLAVIFYFLSPSLRRVDAASSTAELGERLEPRRHPAPAAVR
jgi:MFS family permease